jgi:hypothetical protein
MSIGQGVLGASSLDVAALDPLGNRIADRERRRAVEHASQLTDILELHRVYGAAGMALATPAYVALLLNCSEHRARTLLSDAQVLERLGGLPAMRSGLMTVEQARVVVDLLGSLSDDLSASLWERTAARLATDLEQEQVRPPARLRELLKRWLIAADPEGAVQRRRAAVDDADVELWRRDDGLVDLAARALSPADAQACLDRIEQLAQPSGPDDTRTAGQRRRQALVDLLIGRHGVDDAARCCPPGAAAPCGAHVFVHVPLPTALGTSDEPAEQVGHGPIDAEQLADLLAAAPVLHRVWVDHAGVPLDVDDETCQVARDPAELQGALTQMRQIRPPERPPPLGLHRPHLADPGSYRPTARQSRFVRARAPRCEWPGCGRRASRTAATGCDLDHDLAWPLGPTCPSNLGPLCRRHHRIKQLDWHKRRRDDGSVRWTGPTGRAWTSPHQHSRRGALPRGVRRVAPGVWHVPTG